MQFTNYIITLSISDLIVLFAIETFIFWFINNKITIKDIAPVIFTINAVKLGFLSLTFLAQAITTFYYGVAYLSAWLLISGYIGSTLLYQHEFYFDRKEATHIAFQTSVLSSIVWFFYVTQAGSIFNPLKSILESLLIGNIIPTSSKFRDSGGITNGVELSNTVNFYSNVILVGIAIFAVILLVIIKSKRSNKLNSKKSIPT